MGKRNVIPKEVPLTPEGRKYLELWQKRMKARQELAKRRRRLPKTGIIFVPRDDAPAAFLVKRGGQIK